MTDYQINDKWILDRVSSQSSSFSGWMTDLLKVVEQLNPEVYEDLKKDKDFTSLKDMDKELAHAQAQIANMGRFGTYVNKMGNKISN